MIFVAAAVLLIQPKSVCQLEGSDHGGRDSAAELALAGTIDVQMSNGLLQPADFGASPIRRQQIIHLTGTQSTNFSNLCRNFR
jgi:hypothetical protein